MADERGTMIALGGLWKNTAASGVTYLSGSFGFAKLLVFKNNRKERENQPDYLIYLAPMEKKTDEAATNDGVPF